MVGAIVLTVVLMAGFSWLIASTSLGRQQRACEQDMKMAALLGVDVDRTISLTFVMGAALAAVAGMLFLMYYGVIDFFIGFLAGIKAFTAAVLGGIGSLPGAMLGGLLIGLIAVALVVLMLMFGSVFLAGLLGVILTFFSWFGKIIKEAHAGDHTPVVQLHQRYGMILFITSEVFFFLAFFWAFFDSSLFPAAPEMPGRTAANGGVWPPKVTMTPSGRSTSQMLRTFSRVSGSK